MNRRDFIKTAFAGGAALCLPDYLLAKTIDLSRIGTRILGGLERETKLYLSLPGVSKTGAEVEEINNYIRLIKYSSGITLASLTAKLSLASPYYFVTQVSSDIRWLSFLSGIVATWNDGTNPYSMVPGTAGTGETYSEQCTDPTLDNAGAWNADAGWSVTGGKAVASTAGSGNKISQAVGAAGQLAKVIITCDSLSAGTFAARYRYVSGATRNSAGTFSSYIIGGASSDQGGIISTSGLTATFTDISILQVLTPGIGFNFSAGSGASFNPNAASFSLTVARA